MNQKITYILLLFILISKISLAQNYRIIESNNTHIKLQIDFNRADYKIIDTTINGKRFSYISGGDLSIRTQGEPWLPDYLVHIGIPQEAKPQVIIQNVETEKFNNKSILPVPKFDPKDSQIDPSQSSLKVYAKNKFFPEVSSSIIDDYHYRSARLIILNCSPFQYNPVSRELVFNKKLVLQINYGTNQLNKVASANNIDNKTNAFLQQNVINYQQAINWSGNNYLQYKTASDSAVWYNPNKNYLKIYVNKKGLYRVNYNQIISSGLQMNSVSLNKMELFNNGKQVPILAEDVNHNGIFDTGDYFEFVGYPPTPTEYTTINIYNNSNVYFFSAQADTSGLNYSISKDNITTWDNTYQTSYTTLHFERDSLFENLGYAGDDHRDFWYWDVVTGENGTPVHGFEGRFNSPNNMDTDSNKIDLKIYLHGQTNSLSCSNDHKANIYLTGKLVGQLRWGGQKIAIFSKSINTGANDFPIYPTGNIIQVQVDGTACAITKSDQILVNWFEIGYWRDNRSDSTYYAFTSPPNVTGKIRFWTWQWKRDSINVFIPSKNKIIKAYKSNDNYNSILFSDSVTSSTDYFCAGLDYYLSPDSMKLSEVSTLRSVNNGADYIIISNPKFKAVAERLERIRSQNFPDKNIVNPRIRIVYTNEIYNEFSTGLVNPNALHDFVKYAYDSWQKPAPSYVVLIGDFSHDYRHILSTSRNCYVPSIPYYSYDIGEGISDNNIVTVSGNDIHPDLAIGRISIETVNQGNIILDKLANYPEDNSKEWKRNVLLLSSGLNEADEKLLGLNSASIQLEQSYLIPNGIYSTKVMRYPLEQQYLQYQGGGPEIRKEIDKGAVLINYYGHGGGYQWDLVFLNDDIYQLNNGGRLPLVLSLTCYTAHFDDQDVFGEQFNKVPGKGSIGFFGNSGLTYWNVAKNVDNLIFDEFFNKRNYITGNVFTSMKTRLPASGYNVSQIQLLDYLGDPVFALAIPSLPDFKIQSSGINVSSENPMVDDTLSIKVNIQNVGIKTFNDTVTVQMHIQSPDTAYDLAEQKIPVFGITDSLYYTWIPKKAGLYNVSVQINGDNKVPEDDHSDNSASLQVAVYNLNYPNIIGPYDGYSSQENSIEFKISDIGTYLSHPLSYYIQIDTNLEFSSPIKSSSLAPNAGIVKWKSPNLNHGIYFWRSRIYDGKDSSKWSLPRSFTVSNQKQFTYSASGKQFEQYNIYNMNLSSSGLTLNTSTLPPHPDNKTFLEDVNLDSSIPDTVNMTAITTDGSYLYFGEIWYYALHNNANGDSKIYKVGTGMNGTIKGKFYGTLPNFYAPIKNSMFYLPDGYLYIAYGSKNNLLKVDPVTGDTSKVKIPQGLLGFDTGKNEDGAFYLAADSNLVYNLTVKDSLGNSKYVLRTLSPKNGWIKSSPDFVLSGSSYNQTFSDFFVADGYIYPTEYFDNDFMRRIKISDGTFEEEWITYTPFQSYYAWCYDYTNNLIYASTFRGKETKFSKFKGRYKDARGFVVSPSIGPSIKWKNLAYSINKNNGNGIFSANVLGENKITKNWDTLAIKVSSPYNLSNISSSKYNNLKIAFDFVDSSFSDSNPISLSSLAIDYSSLPELSIDNSNLIFSADTVMQGLPIDMTLRADNFGYSSADTAAFHFYLNNADAPFQTIGVIIPQDSTRAVSTSINTNILHQSNKIKVVATLNEPEFYSFNNILEKSFFVSRDSVPPMFSITFDGNEIYDGDVISAKPKIEITLKDNSPLPLDTTDFSIVFDDNPLSMNRSDLKFTYTQYPNSKATVEWKPALKDGEHTLSIFAKDASNNYFDTTSYRISFFVSNESDLRDVYNYPNPFKNDTYFTFELTGSELPDDFSIKIYTVAGRLIREMRIPASQIKIGFNKIYWNGRDQDGDEVANGLYFYKIVSKINGTTKSVTQKLARVR